MKTIIIDSDERLRKTLLFLVGTINVLNIVGVFNNPNVAIEYVKNNPTDLVILNIQTLEMDKFVFSKKLLEINPGLNLIYMTREKIFEMGECYQRNIDLSLKSLNSKEIQDVMQSLKQLEKSGQKHIYARTFGYFDLFVDGRPIMFKSAKAKELLAFLIDRQGGTVTTDQIITVLWENRPNDEATQSLCSKVVKKLKRELDECKIGSILIHKRGVRSIDVSQIECDMYELMRGSAKAKEQFFGDYMLEYSWAEGRVEALKKRAESISDKKN